MYVQQFHSYKAPTRFELVIEVLQTFALPLGYGAASAINYNKCGAIRQENSFTSH